MIKFAMPNERLMTVHFLNVLIYTFIYIVGTVYYILFAHSEDKILEISTWKNRFGYLLLLCMQGIFQIYNVLFIYTLLLKQTRERKDKSEVIDSVLNKKVPSIVFIQN